MDIKLSTDNPVAQPTAATRQQLAEVYHLDSKADATILPEKHYKNAYNRAVTYDVVLDDKTVIPREVVEFVKKANKLTNGKLPYGRVIGYEEAKAMMALQAAQTTVQAAQVPAQAIIQPTAASPVQLAAPTVAQIPVLPVQSVKVDAAFSGPFGRLKVRYDEAFVCGISLVLVQHNDGASWEPPETGDQSIGIEVLGKKLVCVQGTRIKWPNGSMTVDLFFIDKEVP